MLYDCGVVHTKEPFQRLVNQGLILGPVEHTAYYQGDTAVSAKDVKENADGNPVLKKDQSPVEARTVTEADVTKKGDNFVLKADNNVRVVSKAVKMSKSRGNVVNPDDVIVTTGADALRLYLMFMGPLEQVLSLTYTHALYLTYTHALYLTYTHTHCTLHTHTHHR